MRLAREAKQNAEKNTPKRVAKKHGRVHAYWRFVVREISSVLTKVISLVTIAALFLVMTLDGGRIALPRINEMMQAWAKTGLEGQELTIGSVEFSLGQGEEPAGLHLSDVELSTGDVTVLVPKVDTAFTMLNGIQGLIRPQSIEVSGVSLNFIRDKQNRFAILSSTGEPVVFLGAEAQMSSDTNIADLIAGLANFDNIAVLEDLQEISLSDITVSFVDQRSGKRWKSKNAHAQVLREGKTIIASLDATLSDGQSNPIRLKTRLKNWPETGQTSVTAAFEDVPSADLAAQVNALAWTDVFDGSVSGNLSLEYEQASILTAMTGVLEVGPGKIEPEPGQSIGFDGAKSYFSFDPKTDVFSLEELSVDTAFGAVSVDGKVLVSRDEENGIAGLTGQLGITRLNIKADNIFAQELNFDAGQITARVNFDPFRVDLGEALLFDGESRIELNGRVKPGVKSWDVALNANVRDISHDRAMQLWPEKFRPNLRSWLDKQIVAGHITSLDAYLRTPNGAPEIGLNFAFNQGHAYVLNTMPPIKNAIGHGELVKDRLSIVLESGQAHIGDDQIINLAGSRFLVADTRIKNAPAMAIIKAEAEIPALLKVINRAPLNLMDRFGRDTDLAQGVAMVTAELAFDLVANLRAKDVNAFVRADLFDVTSDQIIPTRKFSAETLHLTASNEALNIGGSGILSDVPLEFEYAQVFTGEEAGPGSVQGTMPVTNANLQRLGINLPSGAISGQGSGRFQIDLRGEKPPRYTVNVGLGGNGINIPELNWSKPAGPAARVALSGVLSNPVTVENVEFSGPGLKAKGRLKLSSAGLALAEFSNLSVGGWLDAPLTWNPQRNSASIRGGVIDLRRSPALNSRSAGNVALSLAPNTVIVSDGVRLSHFSGNIQTQNGTRGRFKARVNGGAQITGVIQPGSAVFIQGQDGGAVLRDAGFFSNASGGVLRVSLKPLASGVFDGRFSLKKTRATDAPVLANMLSLVSVFGLIDRLGGKGIVFDDVQGWFTLSKNRLTITKARAVGPSMGITLSGTYQLNNERLNMEGVLSPFYFVNGLAGRIPGLGRILGGRNGEGLLGASFQITGTSNNPATSINPLSLLTPGASREIFASRPALQPAKN